MKLPNFHISALSNVSHIFIEAIHDTTIHEAIRNFLVRRFNEEPDFHLSWQTAIIQRGQGMLLLKPGSAEFPLHGLLYSTPTCGDESEAAGGTCYLLQALGISSSIDDLYHGLVTVYSHILIREIHTGSPIYQPIDS